VHDFARAAIQSVRIVAQICMFKRNAFVKYVLKAICYEEILHLARLLLRFAKQSEAVED
jgi:hypothetical protein